MKTIPMNRSSLSRPGFLFSSSSEGFSLVELAMVLVIVGLIIGVGAPLLRTLVTNIKYSNSRDIVQAAVDSVESWTAGNNSLPGVTACAGTSCNATTFTNAVKNPNDAFNQPLIYLFDANLSAVTPTNNTICGRSTAAISVTTSTNTISKVAFVVFSASSGHAVLSKLGGNAITASQSASGTITLDTTGNDIVQWVTIDELRTKIGCQNAPLAIANNELPYGNVSGNYSAVIFPSGGGTTYNWSISAMSSATSTGLSYGTANGLNILAGTQLLPSSGTPAYAAGNLTLQCGGTSAICSSVSTGSYNFTIQVTDNNGNTAQKSFVLTFSP